MIRSYLGFIVDVFFLVPEEGQACSLRKGRHALPLPRSMHGFSLFVLFPFFFPSLLDCWLAACGITYNYNTNYQTVNNIIIYYYIL
jgi:hypothetical protein